MKKNKRGRILIGMGLMMILAAALLTAYNMYDSFRAGISAREAASYLESLLASKERDVPAFPAIPATEASAPSNVFFVIPTAENVGAAPQTTPSTEDKDEEKQTPAPQATDSVETKPGSTPVPDAYDEVEIPDYVLNPDMEMPVSHYDGQDYIGVLEIPAIDLKISVISKWSYPGLKIAPCRYVGSAYTNDMVISAHNYDSHFGKLNKLYEGAAVIFTDVDGNVFNYRVGMKETLGPYDVEDMVDSGWNLSLFTCTPGGANRVTIRCELRNGI